MPLARAARQISHTGSTRPVVVRMPLQLYTRVRGPMALGKGTGTMRTRMPWRAWRSRQAPFPPVCSFIPEHFVPGRQIETLGGEAHGFHGVVREGEVYHRAAQQRCVRTLVLFHQLMTPAGICVAHQGCPG
jgi:hypothetical protein